MIYFKKIRPSTQGLVMLLSLAFIVTSCIPDDSEELQAEHDRKFSSMMQTYGMTGANAIGDGIYMRFDPADTSSGLHPGDQDYVVVSLVGYNSDGQIVDVTDSADAAADEVYRNDHVYGPVRLNINYTFPGFYNAIQKMPQGSTAIMLFPSDQAFGGYEPYAYKVKLYKVIPDMEVYLENEFNNYVSRLQNAYADSVYRVDSIPGFGKAYSIVVREGTEEVDINYEDSIVINLHAHYVEADPAYVTEFPGRSFFPINESGTEIRFMLQDNSFPLCDLINTVIPFMKLGEIREIVAPSEYVYGSDGFAHPYTGIYIVPPFMDVHYTLEFVEVPVTE